MSLSAAASCSVAVLLLTLLNHLHYVFITAAAAAAPTILLPLLLVPLLISTCCRKNSLLLKKLRQRFAPSSGPGAAVKSSETKALETNDDADADNTNKPKSTIEALLGNNAAHDANNSNIDKSKDNNSNVNNNIDKSSKNTSNINNDELQKLFTTILDGNNDEGGGIVDKQSGNILQNQPVKSASASPSPSPSTTLTTKRNKVPPSNSNSSNTTISPVIDLNQQPQTVPTADDGNTSSTSSTKGRSSNSSNTASSTTSPAATTSTSSTTQLNRSSTTTQSIDDNDNDANAAAADGFKLSKKRKNEQQEDGGENVLPITALFKNPRSLLSADPPIKNPIEEELLLISRDNLQEERKFFHKLLKDERKESAGRRAASAFGKSALYSKSNGSLEDSLKLSLDCEVIEIGSHRVAALKISSRSASGVVKNHYHHHHDNNIKPKMEALRHLCTHAIQICGNPKPGGGLRKKDVNNKPKGTFFEGLSKSKNKGGGKVGGDHQFLPSELHTTHTSKLTKTTSEERLAGGPGGGAESKETEWSIVDVELPTPKRTKSNNDLLPAADGKKNPSFPSGKKFKEPPRPSRRRRSSSLSLMSTQGNITTPTSHEQPEEEPGPNQRRQGSTTAPKVSFYQKIRDYVRCGKKRSKFKRTKTNSTFSTLFDAS